VSVENTYDQDLVTLEDCAQALQPLYEQLMLHWQQLSAQYAVAGVVVKLKFADFTQLTREYATNDIELDLFQPLLKQAFSSGNRQQQKRGVRLLGLGLKLQAPITQQQLRLF
jgi:DNA polymerase-4